MYMKAPVVFIIIIFFMLLPRVFHEKNMESESLNLKVRIIQIFDVTPVEVIARIHDVEFRKRLPWKGPPRHEEADRSSVPEK